MKEPKRRRPSILSGAYEGKSGESDKSLDALGEKEADVNAEDATGQKVLPAKTSYGPGRKRLLRVLVACEFSGVVRDAFAALGHDAWSCDLLDSERPGKHVAANVMTLLEKEGWDLMVAFPPCTFLTWAGMSKWNVPGRADNRAAAMRFFMALYNAPVPHIAIENPRGLPCREFRQPDQEVNPFNFGEFERKRVCLWLHNLPPLMLGPLAVVRPKKTYLKSNGRRYNTYFHQGKSGKERSRFFPCIAEAMAKQWGDFCVSQIEAM